MAPDSPCTYPSFSSRVERNTHLAKRGLPTQSSRRFGAWAFFKVLLRINIENSTNQSGGSDELKRLGQKDSIALAIPCNQFGAQQPGWTYVEILQFACTRFMAEYPILDKLKEQIHTLSGQNAAPPYAFLKSSKGGLFGDDIKWNFSKFLIDKEGNVVDRYAPTTSPLSIEKDIKKLLGVA
ncbi:hypothetical protein ACJRO7_019637 [Eucalyptus globulus]|uniref:Glutathione peroxidase n=1 Tax=Eucalyptus globulus TaxID=34317 RepID=A0ABD3KG53_EUCGL